MKTPPRLKQFAKYVFSLLALAITLSACSNSKMTSRLTTIDKSKYQNTNQYPDHRAQQHFFQSSGGKIAYLDLSPDSNLPTLVLIHGVPSSSWLFRKMLPELQQHYRVIAIDLLGYGSSDKPKSNGVNYTNLEQANYTAQLLNSLNVQQYSLLFHDMGGLVAWELIHSNPAQIKHLVVLNTIISEHGFNHPKMEKGLMSRVMSQAFSNNLSSASVLEMTFANMGLTAQTKLTEQECFGYVAPMKEGSDEALYSFYTGFDSALFERLEQQQKSLTLLSGKTLVLWGAKDTVLTTKQLPYLKNQLKNTEYKEVIYPDNAHFLSEEIPAQLIAEITDFID